MSIKTIAGFKNTMDTGSVESWKNSVEFGDKGLNPTGFETDGISKSFSDFLKESVGEVNKLQTEANVAMERLASGETKNLHETLLAVEKAEIAFKTMNQVRSKVIDAYKEIMRMQL
jgi:flagellar hook-basal body complex protein FliE